MEMQSPKERQNQVLPLLIPQLRQRRFRQDLYPRRRIKRRLITENKGQQWQQPTTTMSHPLSIHFLDRVTLAVRHRLWHQVSTLLMVLDLKMMLVIICSMYVDNYRKKSIPSCHDGRLPLMCDDENVVPS